MTTKPRHTTSKRRHGASLRLEKRNEQAAQVDRAIAAHYGSPLEDKFLPDEAKQRINDRFIVRWSVRRNDGGVPFIFEHKAKPGTWQLVAEHEAKLAIKHAGLIAWAHIETVKPGEQE